MKLHQIWAEDQRDDTEYIRNVKAVIEATDIFLKEHIETDPEKTRQVLYDFSKSLWLKNIKSIEAEEVPVEDRIQDDIAEYHNYYYDYIYNQGVYPP